MKRLFAALVLAGAIVGCASTGGANASAAGQERAIELFTINNTGGPVYVYLGGEQGIRGRIEPGANCTTIRLPPVAAKSAFTLGLRYLGEPNVIYSDFAYPFGSYRFWMMDLKTDPNLLHLTFNSVRQGPRCAEISGASRDYRLRLRNADNG